MENLVFIFCLLTVQIPATFSAYSGIASTYSFSTADFLDCGIPFNYLNYQHIASLNIFNLPNDYTSFLARPISDSTKVGMYKNGDNCGKFIRITLKRYCSGGTNTGATGTSFCQGGTWTTDTFTNAYQDFLIVEGCQNPDKFCRDDINHVTISQSSLSKFILNGVTTDVSSKWNNREISWDFVNVNGAPEPFKIYWKQDAQNWWPVVIIVGVNGISKVEQVVNGVKTIATKFSDQGLAWVLQNGDQAIYQINIFDKNSALFFYGSISSFQFAFPPTCAGQLCSSITEVQKINF